MVKITQNPKHPYVNTVYKTMLSDFYERYKVLLRFQSKIETANYYVSILQEDNINEQ